jgi:hypothetical protein
MESIGIQKTNSEKSLCQSNVVQNEFRSFGLTFVNESCYFGFINNIGFKTIEDISTSEYTGLSFVNKDCYINLLIKVMQ